LKNTSQFQEAYPSKACEKSKCRLSTVINKQE